MVRAGAPKIIEHVLLGNGRVRFEFVYFETEVSRHPRSSSYSQAKGRPLRSGEEPASSFPGLLSLLLVVIKCLLEATQHLSSCLEHRLKFWLIHLRYVLAQVSDDLLQARLHLLCVMAWIAFVVRHSCTSCSRSRSTLTSEKVMRSKGSALQDRVP